VPGLQALLIGPFDLAVSMGLEGEYRHPDVVAGVHRMIEAARIVNLPVIMPVFSPEPQMLGADVAIWSKRGVRMFAIGADKILLAQALQNYRHTAAGAP